MEEYTTKFSSELEHFPGEELSNFYQFIQGVDTLHLCEISVSPTDDEEYDVVAKFEVNGKKLTIEKTTSEIELMEAWLDGANGSFDASKHEDYDNWKHVLNNMIDFIDEEEEIYFFVNED